MTSSDGLLGCGLGIVEWALQAGVCHVDGNLAGIGLASGWCHRALVVRVRLEGDEIDDGSGELVD